jgi:hypothetical protein
MVEWFQRNFEDPVHQTPFESAEGGYIYLWGGPYDAAEELGDAFSDCDAEDIEAAVDAIEEDGITDWAPAGIRIQPEIDSDDDVETETLPPLTDQLAALAHQLDDIEQHIQYWRKAAPSFGHNNPPEELRLGVSDDDLAKAQQGVEDVRAELARPDAASNADPEILARAESRFRKLAVKVIGWLKAVSGIMTAGALEEAGKDLWSDPMDFYGKLTNAASTISAWLHYLHLPF